ncbi:MAG: ComEC/Rec2 family competence protein [Actinomycetota bacterium]
MADPHFAAYPAPFVLDAPDGNRIQQLIWGDYVEIKEGRVGEWVEVRARRENGWMHESTIQDERVLEINFVDVGQGDGSFIVTPDDEFIVVDAGESDNMYRFLNWRFNLRRGGRIRFKAAVITHSDVDHYMGFQKLFGSSQFSFESLFHNGIVERTGTTLGPAVRRGRISYLTDVVTNKEQLDQILSDPALVGRKYYPTLLKAAADGGRVGDFRMLSVEDGFMPGFEEGGDLEIRVLGPVPERVDGHLVLRRLGSDGETKNGHSVLLMLRYRGVRIFMGGDLNTAAERYLLQHYTGTDPAGASGGQRGEMVAAARELFEADVAKACHHGSADFTDAFVEGVNATATIVSSGDDEPFAHPRPDTLGAIGRWSRGERPLVFSTELARSHKENVKRPEALRAELRTLYDRRERTTDAIKREAIQGDIDGLLATIEREVAVYGLINVRTDGNKVVVAQKLERPGPRGVKWDYHQLEADDAGRLRLIPG